MGTPPRPGPAWSNHRASTLRAIALVVALVVWQCILGWFLAPPAGHVQGDSSQYLHLAVHLLRGRGFAYDREVLSREADAHRLFEVLGSRPRGLFTWEEDRDALCIVAPAERRADLVATRIRQPMYPAFLCALFALFGYRPLAVFLAQAAIVTATSLLCIKMAGALWPRRRGISWIAAGLTLLYVPLHVLSSLVLADALFTFLVICSAYLTARTLESKSLLLAAATGLVLGLSVLTKPLRLLVAVWLAGCALIRLRRQRAPCGIALLAALAFPLLLWAGRNWHACGRFTPLSSEGPINLWYGTYEPMSPWAIAGYEVPPDEVERVMGDAYDFTPDANAKVWAEAKRRILADPARFVLQGVARVIRVGVLDYPGGRSMLGPSSPGAYRLTQLGMALVWVLFALGVADCRTHRAVLLVVPASVVPTCLVLWVPGRALAPFHVLGIVGAAAGVLLLWERLQQFRRPPRNSGNRTP